VPGAVGAWRAETLRQVAGYPGDTLAEDQDLTIAIQRAGWQVRSVPVNHRARGAGVSKYNNLGRALVGIADLRGVSWLIRRSKRTGVEEV